MGLKARIATNLTQAMRDRDAVRLSTLRLITAAIKDREIALRGGDEGAEGIPEEAVLAILAKMVKQRNESARAYEEGGRLELAEQERAEIGILEEFLPRQLTEDEEAAAIDAAVAETEASSIRDMGRVMGVLKANHAGRMDFARVGPKVRERLG